MSEALLHDEGTADAWGAFATTGGDIKKINWLKLENSKAGNTLRFVSKPHKYMIHWEYTTAGTRKKFVCPGDTMCPVCLKDNKEHPDYKERQHRPAKRFFVTVLDETDTSITEPVVCAFETGASVINEVVALATNQTWGDPKNYSINIRKSGAGRDTVYKIAPIPNMRSLTNAEIEAINEAAIDYDKINKVPTAEEIKNFGLKYLATPEQLAMANTPSDLGDDVVPQSVPQATTSEPLTTISGGSEDQWDSFVQ